MTLRSLAFLSPIFSVLVFVSSVALAQPPSVQVVEVANTLSSAIGATHAGDGSGRLFVVQKTGEIRVWDGTQVLIAPFLDLSSLVSGGNEQGLLGLAFHPNYASNGLFYVNYTDLAGDTVVARYTTSPPSSNTANAASVFPILGIAQPAANHNAGDMHFGTDGFLYIASGDGGANAANGQDSTTLLGELLRIDIDGDDFPADPNRNYAIPATNPLVGVAGAAEEIFVQGLRNPWRFSFDRANGDLFIGDVGVGSWEEVDWLPAGAAANANLGWPCYEGPDPFNLTGCGPIGSYQFPIVSLAHGPAPLNHCSVIGGFRYRGSFSALVGYYFFSDWCTGQLWAAWQDGGGWSSQAVLDLDTFTFTGFAEDEAGELYLAGGFRLLRIIADEVFGDGFESGNTSSWSTVVGVE